ncbi:hypothetical protein [Escherichia coli]|nr:hypothetical protein [Escherichia coli]MDO2686783.1 hypothetical protein [Escherichia coli]QLM31013.1 hypothetical protein HVV64_16695 [Escherichia coli]
MTEMDALLDSGASGILTPHSLHPLRSKVAVSGDEVFLQCGAYNLGFLALSRTAESLKMLSWWKSKLKWQCEADFSQGLFVDQKWFDLVPSYFDGFEVLKSPLYNLAPWNCVHYSILSDFNGKYFVDNFESPVAFIHFSGMKRAEEHFMYMNDARNFYLEELRKYQFLRLPIFNYKVIFKPAGLVLDKICIFLYKEYVSTTNDKKTDPLSDWGFYNFLIGYDAGSGLPRYIKKLIEIFPEIMVNYYNSIGKFDFDTIISWLKDGFNYDGVVSLSTVISLRNVYLKNENKNVKGFDIQPLNLTGKYLPAIDTICLNNIAHRTNNGEVSVAGNDGGVELSYYDVKVYLPDFNCGNELVQDESKIVDLKKFTEIWVPNIASKDSFIKKYNVENVTVIPYPVTKNLVDSNSKPLISLPDNKFSILCYFDCLDAEFENNLKDVIGTFKKAFNDINEAILVCYLANCHDGVNVENLNGDEKIITFQEPLDEVGSEFSRLLTLVHCVMSVNVNASTEYVLAQALCAGVSVIYQTELAQMNYLTRENSFCITKPFVEHFNEELLETFWAIYNGNYSLGASAKLKNAVSYINKHFSDSTIGFIMAKRLVELQKLVRGDSYLLPINMLGNLDGEKVTLRSFIKKIPFAVPVYRRIKYGKNYRSLFPLESIAFPQNENEREIAEKVKNLNSLVNILVRRTKKPALLE